MFNKKSIITLIITSLLIYNILPIINVIFPNTANYTFLTDLWITNSLYSLISSFIMTKKYGFHILVIFLIAILFAPTMIIFYNSSALIFIIVYFILALIGGLTSSFIYKQRKENSWKKQS